MTTTITVHPAGHHVRVTTTDHYEGQEPQVSTVELAPGTASHSTYVTSNRSIKIEEYVPTDAAADADEPAEPDYADEPADDDDA